MEPANRNDPEKIVQLHLVLPYKHDPRDHHRVRRYLEQGYRIRQLQRVSDQELLITLVG